MTENRSKSPQLNDANDSNKIIGFAKTEIFSGPVPTPEVIERYEKIYPGAAKIISDKWDSHYK